MLRCIEPKQKGVTGSVLAVDPGGYLLQLNKQANKKRPDYRAFFYDLNSTDN